MTDTEKNIPEWRQRMTEVPMIGSFFVPKKKVAVIRLSGVISENASKRGGISYNRYHKLIEKAFKISGVEEVVLLINSPGGAPAQCSLITNLIRMMADDSDIHVSAFIEDIAASGGYWIACAADKIYVQSSSIVGSIGVISASFGFQELIAKYGVERRIHTSGKEKSFMDPFVPEKPNDQKRLQAVQGAIHEDFIDWVKQRRGDKIEAPNKDIFEGQFWAGHEAVDLGMVDAIGSLRAVMREKYGDDVRFLELQPEKPLIKQVLGIPGMASASQNWADDLVDAVEYRAMWSRFGL